MNRIVLLALGAVLISLTLGTVYVAVQQVERQGADDAGWRLASQVGDELAAGRSDTAAALPRVDLSTSLAPFVLVFDRTDAPVAGNGYLGGVLATVPRGVLEAARAHGSNHVTWQPAPGLRFATVELRAGRRIVLAGQSLRPSEARTDALGILLVAAWLGILAVAALGLLGAWWFGRLAHAAVTPAGNR